jgi:tripartite ATP-independent transporter DctM subunit
MLLGAPVAFAFLAVDVVGVLIFMGGEGGLLQLIANATESLTKFTLVPVPLFVMMGELFFHTGLARRVFDAFDTCFGRLPGRLSYVTVAGGTAFATLSGSSMANTAMLGSLMVPEMLKRGYKKHMAIGPILGTGGLAMIIPPSTLAVLLGTLARVDIGALLIAGILPGLLLAAFYAALIYGQTRIDPSAAPEYPAPQVPFTRKLRIVVVNVLPMSLVIFLVVGLILLGVATPTESAAFGVLGVLLLGAVFRCLTWGAIVESLTRTISVTAMVFMIIIGSTTFSQLLAFSGATSGILSVVTALNGEPLLVLLVMMLVLLFLGAFMDQVSMMLLTLPVFIPLAQSLGFDLVWFGLLMLLGLEVGLITPPFGLLLFVMMGVAPKGTTLPEVALAGMPYVVCALFVIGLVVAFPEIALYMPGLMK